MFGGKIETPASTMGGGKVEAVTQSTMIFTTEPFIRGGQVIDTVELGTMMGVNLGTRMTPMLPVGERVRSDEADLRSVSQRYRYRSGMGLDERLAALGVGGRVLQRGLGFGVIDMPLE